MITQLIPLTNDHNTRCEFATSIRANVDAWYCAARHRDADRVKSNVQRVHDVTRNPKPKNRQSNLLPKQEQYINVSRRKMNDYRAVARGTNVREQWGNQCQ